MRLLIVGSTSPESLENAYHRAFRSQNDVKIERCDTRVYRHGPIGKGSPLRLLHNRYTYALHAVRGRRALRQLFRNAQDPYDAVLVFKGMELSPEIIQECREEQPGAVWININPDNPFNIRSIGSTNAHVLAALPLYDVYCIWSRALVQPLREAGCGHVEYLPFGYDPEIHRPPKRQAEKSRTRAVFIGTWDPLRQMTLEALAGTDLRIFGPRWDRVPHRSPLRPHIDPQPLFGEQLASESASAAVCLNLLRPQNEGAHNMRTFEIPAVGGLMLTTRSAEQDAFFREGEASFMYADANELRDTIARIADDEAFARQVRARGEMLVRQHTYGERAKTVRAFIEEVRKQRD